MVTIHTGRSDSRWGAGEIGRTELRPTYRADLRRTTRDVYAAAPPLDLSQLSWRDVGRPHQVRNYAADKRAWESEHGQSLPVPLSWRMFNESFQSLFDTEPVRARLAALRRAGHRLSRLELRAAFAAATEIVQWTVWNQAQRVQDTIWDPRGKRALFAGLPVQRPRVLFLGAADGYEAMLLQAMYPGGEAVLVDYDDYCVQGRFEAFPVDYPFLGVSEHSGHPRVWHRDQMNISYVVSDIRDLDFGPEFDIVVSIGLVEHFPDEYKPLAFSWHRRFLRPGGFAILTTPRVSWRTRLFYQVFADAMNYCYRELMTSPQLALYAHENGFEVLRHGEIDSHNGVVCRAR